MPFMIDGHNLIPTLGLQLNSMDDELDLIEMLQEFCRIQRTRVEVYFDGAPPGTASIRRMGAVSAHFVRIGLTADAAIERHLTRLGKQARGWTVVSSDGRVQTAGRAMHARIMSSEEFTSKMRSGKQTTGPKPDKELKPEEIQEWMDLFNKKK